MEGTDTAARVNDCSSGLQSHGSNTPRAAERDRQADRPTVLHKITKAAGWTWRAAQGAADRGRLLATSEWHARTVESHIES